MEHLATVRPINVVGAEKWTANVDYLTCTTDMQLDVPAFRGVAENLRLMAIIAGAAPKDVNWQGYRGWRCGTMFYGERSDGAVLDVKGSLADICWEHIKHHARNVSRLDVCLTAWFATDPSQLVNRVRAQHVKNKGGLEKMKRPIPRYHDGMGNGDTYYVGSHSSNKMFRCYDKQRQSNNGEYIGATRWEFQYRNEDAYRTHMALLRTSNRIDTMAGLIARDCEEWKIPYPYVTNTRPAPILLSYQATDLDGKKRWFKEQVAAAIRRMGYLPGMEDTMKHLVDTMRQTGYSC